MREWEEDEQRRAGRGGRGERMRRGGGKRGMRRGDEERRTGSGVLGRGEGGRGRGLVYLLLYVT